MVNGMLAQIKEKMLENGLNAYTLERQAGLKPSAVHNILYGRSKNPSINTLLSLAKALNCTVSDLIGENQNFLNGTTGQPATADVSEPLSLELYTRCLAFLTSFLAKKKIWVDKQQILSIAEEVYRYCLKKGLINRVDPHFVKWLIEKNFK